MVVPPNTIIAAGPVIIENGKVLLNRKRHLDGHIEPLWMIPGGHAEQTDTSMRDTCIREAKEELGIDLIIIRPLETLFIDRPDHEGKVILVHYLAKRVGEITANGETVEFEWFEINNLPKNCAPNIKIIIDLFLAEKNMI